MAREPTPALQPIDHRAGSAPSTAALKNFGGTPAAQAAGSSETQPEAAAALQQWEEFPARGGGGGSLKRSGGSGERSSKEPLSAKRQRCLGAGAAPCISKCCPPAVGEDADEEQGQLVVLERNGEEGPVGEGQPEQPHARPSRWLEYPAGSGQYVVVISKHAINTADILLPGFVRKSAFQLRSDTGSVTLEFPDLPLAGAACRDSVGRQCQTWMFSTYFRSHTTSGGRQGFSRTRLRIPRAFQHAHQVTVGAVLAVRNAGIETATCQLWPAASPAARAFHAFALTVPGAAVGSSRAVGQQQLRVAAREQEQEVEATGKLSKEPSSDGAPLPPHSQSAANPVLPMAPVPPGRCHRSKHTGTQPQQQQQQEATTEQVAGEQQPSGSLNPADTEAAKAAASAAVMEAVKSGGPLPPAVMLDRNEGLLWMAIAELLARMEA